MIRASWCKKLWSGRSKGLSTVLGTIFLTLVVFMVSANVFLWTISQSAQYTQAVKDENQKNVDRLSENVIASGVNYSVSGDDITVEVTLTNAGPVAVQIINIWVFDTDISNQRYTNKSLDLNLNPGEVLNLRGFMSLTVTIPGANASHNFVSWFVTSRGNNIPLEKEQDMTPEYVETHSWIDMGTLRFHFEHHSLNFTSENHHDPLPGWVVPGDEYVMFHIKIVNTGKVPITLQKYCCFYLMEYMELQGSSQRAWSFYIVSSDSLYPQDKMYHYDEENNPYVIQPNPEGKWWLGGPPVTVKFGSYKVGDNLAAKLSSDPDVPYLAFIGLFYKYVEDGEEYLYGQTIPFVAIRSVRPYSPP